MADKSTSVEDIPERRACYLCGRDSAIVRRLGGLTLKEPCPNKCGPGYMKWHAEQAKKERE